MNVTFKTIKNKAKFALITYKFENLIEIKLFIWVIIIFISKMY